MHETFNQSSVYELALVLFTPDFYIQIRIGNRMKKVCYLFMNHKFYLLYYSIKTSTAFNLFRSFLIFFNETLKVLRAERHVSSSADEHASAKIEVSTKQFSLCK